VGEERGEKGMREENERKERVRGRGERTRGRGREIGR
jgi:hypothetical protein